jgi:uncharacterized protein (DUF885 family)
VGRNLAWFMLSIMSIRTPCPVFWSSVMLSGALVMGCGPNQATAPAAGSGDAAFRQLANDILEDHYKRHPSESTDLGIHRYDDQLEDLTETAIAGASAALKDFRSKLAAIDSATLTLTNALDREQLIHSMDTGVLARDTIKMWTKDPDTYSSDVSNAAYVIMKRNYAPAAERLRVLIAREKKMPAMLQEARKNVSSPVQIYTQIAIEQIDGDISFFRNDVPSAFKDVNDRTLLAEFKQTNNEAIAALGAYKTFLQKELLPKAMGAFAYGGDTYVKALAASEAVDLPLDRLLQLAGADREKNEEAFQATVKKIDPNESADRVFAALEVDHPPAARLLQATQDTLDSIRQFIVDHHIITMPPGEPARVKETPPFMRSTTSASMDTPGPFETAKLQAFYNMTLPDPRRPRAEQDDYMRQWYFAMISNVSVHEVYPGHYIQFLYAKEFPSDVRKVFGANTNSEGWAHYSEQMMLDEGFHADDPRYRLAQLQDALLRDVRFIVGIKMHTQGMSVDEATKLFETQAHQPHSVALQEAKRGTADALYGYYTIGKLMIVKLRDDYRVKMGAEYSLQRFHDAFIKLGPLPLPLIRKAMLGEVGAVL